MDWPKITLVTPTYERTQFLEQTIDSVLSQNYPNLEYIIVDGNSKNDKVLEIIKRHERHLAWWISEPDSGHAEAIRKGFDRATGELMNWLCSDDTLFPGALEAVALQFRRSPKADVVFGYCEAIDERGDILWSGRPVRYHPLMTLTEGQIHQASVFWRRALYEKVGGHVGGRSLEYTRYSPDSDLFMRFARAGARWVLIRRSLSTFRMHQGQTSTSERDLVTKYARQAGRENFPIWGRTPFFEIASLWMKTRRWRLQALEGEFSYLYRRLKGQRADDPRL